MNGYKPRVMLNMDALAHPHRTEVAAECERVYAELMRAGLFDLQLVAGVGRGDQVDNELRQRGIDQRSMPVDAGPGGQPAILVQPAGHVPPGWRNDLFAIVAHIIVPPVVSPASLGSDTPTGECDLLAAIDRRSVLFVPTPQAKEDVLRARPDLSPAQVTVLASQNRRDAGKGRSALVEALLDTDRRMRAQPMSMLWQYPGAEPESPLAPATFLGYRNGAAGPFFDMKVQARPSQWPMWSDALTASDSPLRRAGGLRADGVVKRGTDELPLVSYVTVVRNNAATLERAIESVQQQTYPNVEHIVLDGASTDGTVDVILRNAARLDYFVSEPDSGLYDAINKAVPLAHGQLICILNSDDWLEPHAAEIAVRRMRGRVDTAALLATGAVIYTQAGEVAAEWPPMFVHPGSYFACANVCHNGVYATRGAYERSGPYDATFRIAADFKWVMSCLDAGVQFAYTREVTVNYSLGGTSGDAQGHSRECQRVIAERFPFLSRQEVLGLYDGYFLFAHQPHEEVERPHEAATSLLRRLFAENLHRPDFQLALTWAAMTKLEHPSDRPALTASTDGSAVPPLSRSAKDLGKGLLCRFPRLYKAAQIGYAWMRR
ncbi:glycosyltransferase family 2 protein [Variovorax sp.]|uniref:glycosyltransferase family 2 protein n=1 Tax=Variovorax sp. TaxID=1871043 RepID=UPI002D2A0FB4|nr:glycosyltransferase family 2 protein [Variovorax sp.]HYP82106.1 glycosyltransferase family 2 protein [Variovorax sp.]